MANTLGISFKVDVRCSRVTWTNTASASTADAHPTSSRLARAVAVSAVAD